MVKASKAIGEAMNRLTIGNKFVESRDGGNAPNRGIPSFASILIGEAIIGFACGNSRKPPLLAGLNVMGSRIPTCGGGYLHEIVDWIKGIDARKILWERVLRMCLDLAARFGDWMMSYLVGGVLITSVKCNMIFVRVTPFHYVALKRCGGGHPAQLLTSPDFGPRWKAAGFVTIDRRSFLYLGIQYLVVLLGKPFRHPPLLLSAETPFADHGRLKGGVNGRASAQATMAFRKVEVLRTRWTSLVYHAGKLPFQSGLNFRRCQTAGVTYRIVYDNEFGFIRNILDLYCDCLVRVWFCIGILPVDRSILTSARSREAEPLCIMLLNDRPHKGDMFGKLSFLGSLVRLGVFYGVGSYQMICLIRRVSQWPQNLRICGIDLETVSHLFTTCHLSRYHLGLSLDLWISGHSECFLFGFVEIEGHFGDVLPYPNSLAFIWSRLGKRNLLKEKYDA
ncbi:hypothetical protein FNV43_RR01219 [Rhamnella rubrinervis]|uniref:Uncharacterized protein n=1 Tax=Rhamnella rubrinervis TaxID=2594499 RepID=A0A8K0HQ31_9ROSA|nr:hypothetical protein FNV43_RR01219 [Rhamnella rubrinervis]